jgi:hypothetical protein
MDEMLAQRKILARVDIPCLNQNQIHHHSSSSKILHGVAVGPAVDQEYPKNILLGLEPISSDDRASIFMILDFTALFFFVDGGRSLLWTPNDRPLFTSYYLNCHRVQVYRSYTFQTYTPVNDEKSVQLFFYFIFFPLSTNNINNFFDSGNYEDLVAAIDFILKDRVIIAMAETPYVIDGPKVQ